MARVGPSSNDIRPLYPAGAGVSSQEANLGAFAAEVGLRQLLTARYTLVLTVSMGWATNGPDYDLIIRLLVRLGYRVSHFSLSFPTRCRSRGVTEQQLRSPAERVRMIARHR